MKKTFKISLFIFVLGIVISPIFIQATYIEQSGYEDTYTSKCVSKVDIQAHAVYNDNNQGGKTNFGIWTAGEYDKDNAYGKVTIGLYVTAYYIRIAVNELTGQCYTRYYWDPIPSGFMTWNGVYDYNTDGSEVWRWSTGSSSYGFSYSMSHVLEPSASYDIEDSVSGDYRYLGYFRSSNEGKQDFKAFLKLFLDNDLARDYANGHDVISGDITTTYIITKLQFKLEFQFKYYQYFWNGVTDTHEHIMGDGNGDSNDHDLNYIPLVVGSIG